MKRQDQRRIFCDHQRLWRNLDALPAQAFDLLQQMPGVKDNSVADNTELATAHDAAGQRVKLVDLAVYHKGVASIVATLKARDDVGALA